MHQKNTANTKNTQPEHLALTVCAEKNSGPWTNIVDDPCFDRTKQEYSLQFPINCTIG